MRKFSFTVAAATTFAAAAVGLAGTAVAAPTGGGNAGDAVKELQAEVYNLQINGSVTDPLSACVTAGVHGVPKTGSSSGPHSGPLRSRPSMSTSRALMTTSSVPIKRVVPRRPNQFVRRRLLTSFRREKGSLHDHHASRPHP